MCDEALHVVTCDQWDLTMRLINDHKDYDQIIYQKPPFVNIQVREIRNFFTQGEYLHFDLFVLIVDRLHPSRNDPPRSHVIVLALVISTIKKKADIKVIESDTILIFH